MDRRNYGRQGDNKTLLNWLMGVSASGLILAASGMWVMHADVSALRQEVQDMRQEMNRLYALVDHANRP